MSIDKILFKYAFLTLKYLLFSISCVANQAKVLLITHSYNRPDFIETQCKTFKKFLKDEYEFIVFNDAREPSIRKQIHAVCQSLDITCIEIPQDIHDRPYLFRLPEEDFNHSCVRCANVVQYSLNIAGFKHNGIVAIIDSDMFLVKNFSINEYIKNYDIVGIQAPNRSIQHLWNGIVFFNMNTLPNKETINFNCGRINNAPVDVGGYTYYYFEKYPHIKVLYADHIYINGDEEYNDATFCNQFGTENYALLCDNCKSTQRLNCTHNTENLEKLKFDKHQIKLIQAGPERIEFLMDNTFFHYRSGGNWNNKSAEFHTHKTKIFKQFIQDILQS